jgi:uncharacterized membrane protein
LPEVGATLKLKLLPLMKLNAIKRLIVLGFDNDTAAFEMRSVLYDLEDEGLIALGDAVVVTRNDKGKIRLHQSINLTATGTAAGSIAGFVLGMFILNPLFGSVAGSGVGAAIGAAADHGIPDPFMKELGATLKPGSSALFLAMHKAGYDEVLKRLQKFAGKAKLLQTSMPADEAARLRHFLEGPPSAQLPAPAKSKPHPSHRKS